jgi:hypothetical protein
MKFRILLLGIFFGCASANAQTALSRTKDTYVRCTAISFMISDRFQDQEMKARYRSDFDAFTKLIVWFYIDSPSNALVDRKKAMRSTIDDLLTNRLSSNAFLENAQRCNVLLLETQIAFTQCVGKKGQLEKSKAECSKQSVGITT